MPSKQELDTDIIALTNNSVRERREDYSTNKSRLRYHKNKLRRLHVGAKRLFLIGLAVAGITHGADKIIEKSDYGEAKREISAEFLEDVFEPGLVVHPNLKYSTVEHTYNYGTIASELNHIEEDKKRAYIYKLYKTFEDNYYDEYDRGIPTVEKMNNVLGSRFYNGPYKNLEDYTNSLGYESIDDYLDNEGIILEALIAKRAAENNLEKKNDKLDELLNKDKSNEMVIEYKEK